MKSIPLKHNKNQKETRETQWNLRKEGAWDDYTKRTQDCDDLIEATSDENKTIGEMASDFDKIHNKIKFSSFGKIKVKTFKGDKVLVDLAKRKSDCEDDNTMEEIDQKIAERTMSIKSKKLTEEISELKKGGVRPTKVFKVLQKIQGPKQAGPEANAVINPKTKSLATTKDDILEASLDYCSDVLNNNEPAEGFEQELLTKNLLHDVRCMWEKSKEQNEEKVVFDKQELEDAILKLKKKRKKVLRFCDQGWKIVCGGSF